MPPCLEAEPTSHTRAQAPAAAARGLASRASAFVAAPKPVTALRLARPCQAAAAVPVECADGRKGGKLKTRKASKGALRTWEPPGTRRARMGPPGARG